LARSIQFSFKLGNEKNLRLRLRRVLCYHYVHGGVGSTLHKYKEDETNVWTPFIFYHFVMGFVFMHLLFLCLATPSCSFSYHILLLCLVKSYYFILMFHLAIVPCCCQILKYLSRSFQKKKLGLGMANLKFSFPSLVSFSCFILVKLFILCVCIYIYTFITFTIHFHLFHDA
jgi:hypothetical protein